MAGITHSVAATGVDSGDGKVSVNAWNAEHVVPDGALAQAAVAGLVAALAAKQAAADLLTALAALDGTAGILRVTGAGAVTRLTDTAAGRALLTAADAAAQRTALGLGTAATTDATAYATAGHDHTGVYSPTARTISTTAPLAGGGDLSADRTLTVATFGDAQAGVVPASGGGTSNFLRADGTWSAPGGGTPGGASGVVQYNNAGAFGGAANLSIHGGDLVVASGTPTTPSGGAKLYSRDLAGRQMLGQIGPTGLGLGLQPFLARTRVGHWNWPGGNTTALADGIPAPSVVGTPQIRTPASTNLFTSMRRIGYQSAASAGSLASVRSGVAQFWRGNAAGLGGFFLAFRFGASDPATVAGAREFVGLSTATGAATNVEPDTLVNSVGVGQLSTSSNLHVIHNDVGGTATTIDLGVNFPADTLSVDMYELILFAAPNSSEIKYRVERLGTSHVATGSVSSNIPSTTTFLAIQAWRCNNATALAVGLDLVSLYIETDY